MGTTVKRSTTQKPSGESRARCTVLWILAKVNNILFELRLFNIYSANMPVFELKESSTDLMFKKNLPTHISDECLHVIVSPLCLQIVSVQDGRGKVFIDFKVRILPCGQISGYTEARRNNGTPLENIKIWRKSPLCLAQFRTLKACSCKTAEIKENAILFIPANLEIILKLIQYKVPELVQRCILSTLSFSPLLKDS